MKWRYGIVKYTSEITGEVHYGLGELYFDGDPVTGVFACTENPVTFVSDGLNSDNEHADELRRSLEAALKDAIKYPVFDASTLPKGETQP